jgi:hypothetical protein
MYYSLSDKFLNAVDQLVDRSVAVRNLLGSMRAGYHHLVVSRDLVDLAVAHCDLSDGERALLNKHVRPRYSIARGELRSALRYVECVPDHAATNDLPANAIPLNLSVMDEPINSGPTLLVVEDVSRDQLGLETLFYMHQRFVLRRSARAKYQYVHGGGSMTAQTFTHAYASPRPVLCVVDSDRRSPDGALGDTASAVVTAAQAAPHGTADVAVLPVRELENAFPLRVIRMVYQSLGDATVAGKCQTLIDFCEAEPAGGDRRAQMVAFLDFKEGLNQTDLIACQTQFEDVIQALWEYVNGSQSPPICDAAFLSRNPFTGLSNAMLTVVSQNARDKPFLIKDIARNLQKHPFRQQIEQFATHVLDFCAAPTALPVRL